MASANDDGTVINEEKLCLKLHEIIVTLQNENGLRHQDHMRYRHYLSRRLKCIRKSVGFTYGKGKSFVIKEITPDLVKNTTYLMIPLLTAERAWSHASELKDAHSKVGKRKLKHHEIGRFAKAAKWAALVETLCSVVGDDQTALEASAYSSWMSGHSYLEKEMWTEAVTALSKAKNIYEQLSKLGTLDQQDLFSRRVAELEPSIRFCRYNASGSNADSDDLDVLAANPELQAKLEEMQLKQNIGLAGSESAKLGFIWGCKLVNVSSEAMLAACSKVKLASDALISAESSTKSTSSSTTIMMPEDGLGKTRDQEYMRLFSAIDNARELVSDEINKLALGGGGRLGDAKVELNHLKSYLQYKRHVALLQRTTELIKTVERSNVGREKRVYDLAHLYDQLLNTVREMLSVPGCEDDDILTLRLSAQEQILRATRALWIAECYLVETMWDEGSVLVELAESLLSTASSRLDDLAEAVQSSSDVSSEETSWLETLRESLQQLDKQVTGARCRIPALVLLHKLGKNAIGVVAEEVADTTPGIVPTKPKSNEKLIGSLLSRKDVWVEPSKVVKETSTKFAKKSSKAQRLEKVSFGEPCLYSIPPSFAPIPCKPVFFDMAFNYIEAPDIDERAGIPVAKKEAAPVGLVGAAQSLFGWFRT